MKKVLQKVLLSCAAILAVFPVLAQLPPENERGFKPDSVYQLNGVDSVNLFNGNLNLTFELATYPVASDVSYSFELVYSGNLWETHERCIDNNPCTLRVTPQNDNAGLGWRVDQETIFSSVANSEVGSAASLWRYQSGDGSDHYLFDTLHEPKCSSSVTSNCDPVVAGVRYTRDGTYIRMTDSGTAKVLEFPNGTRRRYAPNADGNWSLQYIYGASSALNANGEPVTNWAKFEYVPSTTYTDVVDLHVTDSHGRSHWVYFQPGPGVMPDTVDKFVLAAFKRPEDPSDAAATATYDVTYDAYTLDASGHPVDGPNTSLLRPCLGTGQSPLAPVRLLSRLDLPTGEKWEFKYNQPAACDDSTGTLTEAVLPTGGRLQWTYQNYDFSDVSLSTGVFERRMVEPDDTVASYTRYSLAQPLSGLATTVETYEKVLGQWRLDSKTVNYFNRQSGPLLGLPFNPNTTDGTATARNLSTETYDCDPEANTCSASPETRTYVKYEIDYTNVNASQGCSLDDPCAKERNRRLKSDRTTYVADGSRTADVDRTNFDGLGNYRFVTTSGTFTGGNSRQAYTGFNMNTRGYDPATWTGTSVGTYSLNTNGTRAPGFTMLGTSDAWILGTFTNTFVAEGSGAAHTQECFNPKTGFLHRKRVIFSNDGQAGPKDFLQAYTRDSATGYASRVETFGGDYQPLCDSEVCSEELCTMSLPAHNAYTSRMDYAFQSGVLKTARAVNGATGANMPFFTAEYAIDLNTGLARTSKDVSGLTTTYTYDRGQRVTRVLAPNNVAADYTYTPATSTSAASVSAVAESGDLRRERAWIFDHFGRLTLEKELLPDNVWAARQITYDAAGRRASVSEQEQMTGTTFNPSRKTLYGNYDPSGRVGSVTTPDGKLSTFSYAGARTTTRTYGVMTPSGTQNVSVIEERDRAGRLINVTEDATGTPVITDYTYDVGNRVASVKVRGTTQPARTFVYDGRGTLTSETHPESGTASYTYDSRGLTITKTTPVAVLTNEYDAAGRTTHVREGTNELKVFQYDRANNPNTGDYSLGKVATALRHNRDTSLGANVDVTVLETFFYKNPEGRISGKSTAVSTGETFDQSYAYDPLGRLSTVTYPSCVGCNLLTETARTVSFAYDADRVESVGVPGDVTRYADSIKFHPNGMVREIRHKNAGGALGPLYEQTLKDGMTRPDVIKVSQFCDGFVFSTTPQARTVTSGQPAGLTAVASGATSYEWYKRVGTTDTLVLTQTTQAPLPNTVATTTMFWVRAKNGTCSIDSPVVTVTVVGDTPPVANFTFSCSGRTCSFDGSTSTDDIGITSYQWNFGDSTVGSGQTTGHPYGGTALSFVVTLTVTDTIGQTNQTQRTVALDAIAATLLYTGAIDGEINLPFSLSAQLTRASNGTGISGQPIVFTLGSQTATATTNTNGFAFATITPLTSGNFSVNSSFAGGSGFTSAQDSDPVFVAPIATVTGVVRNAVTLSAVSSATVQLLGGNSTSTNSSGVYSLSTQSGTYTLSAAKGGYGTVNQSVTVPAGQVVSRTIDLPVTTALAYTGPSSGSTQTPLTLTARLTEGLGGATLSGRSVSFQLGAQSASGTTNSSGIASVSITPTTGGNVTLQITFAASGGYAASQTTAPITIASTGAIQGVVSSAVTGLAVSGATVSVSGVGSTLTNAAGQYSIATPAGSFTLATTKTNYVTASSPFTVTGGQTVTMNVSLVATTSLTYSGATTGEINVPLTAIARLIDNASGGALSGRVIGFTLNGAQFTTATTDANGFATVTLTPTVSGSQPLVATFSTFGGWAASQVTTQIAVAAAATISGTIRNAVTLAPIDAASITLSTGGTATTNASGQYSVTTRSGTVTVTASKANYATNSAALSVAPGASVTGNLDLLVLPAIANNSPAGGEIGVPLTLSATLTNSLTTAPITGRQVTFVLGSQTATGTTNASGVASVSLTPSVSGTLPLTISTVAASGYAAAQFNGSMVISPPVVVTGTVRSAVTSQPISGVTMALATGETTTTDASGQYSLAFHSGTNTLTATKTGYVAGSLTGTVTAGQTVVADFTLQVVTAIASTGPASGEIGVPLTLSATATSGASGAPIAGVLMTFTLGAQSASATTNASGIASVTLTPAVSGTMSLAISTPAGGGYAAGQFNGSLVIAPEVVVTGTVRNAATSQPIGGVTMTLATGQTTTTNASGQYSLSLHSGSNTLTAAKAGYVTGSVTGTTTPGQNVALDFALQVMTAITYTGPTTGEINVPLTLTARLNENAAGGVVAGQTLTFTLGSQSATGITNASGVASATITPSASGAQTLTVGFTAAAGYNGSQTTASLTIAAAASLSGIVRNAATLSAVAGATVSIPGVGSATTNASGAYTLSLRSGTYSVSASQTNYVTKTVSVTVTPGQSQTTNFDLLVSVTPLYTGPFTGERNLPFTATVRVNNNVTTQTVAGQVVTFVLGAQTVTGTTAANGVASATLTPLQAGTIPLQFSTAASNGYAASAGTVSLEIADQPYLDGFVRDAVTNGVIGGATVSLSNGATTTTTAGGEFVFGARSGSYVLTASKSGYVTTQTNVTLVAGEVHIMEVALPRSTTITYTGALETQPDTPIVLSARLTEDVGNTVLAGATLAFVFDGEATFVPTDATGLASITVTPSTIGTQTLTVTYAGTASYGSRQITKSIRVGRPPTLQLTGKTSLSMNYPDTVSAVLVDVDGLPLAGRTLTFTIGSVSASATTDALGKAAATITPAGPSAITPLTVSFAGDGSNLSGSASTPVVIYEMTLFSIWGGEEVKPSIGEERVFAGDTWSDQVSGDLCGNCAKTPHTSTTSITKPTKRLKVRANGGDFTAGGFNGMFTAGIGPLVLCQADRSSLSEPPLTDTCLNVSDEDSLPPGTIQLYPYPEMTSAYIAVAVPTSILRREPVIKRGIVVVPGATYGNIAAVAILHVTAYDPETGGSGVIQDIVADGLQLFTAIRYTGPATMQRQTPVTVTARLVTSQTRVALANKSVTFTIGAVSVSATTKADGTATATMNLPASESTGARSMTVSFAGDASEPASTTTATVTVQ